MTEESTNAVVEVARKRKSDEQEIVTLSSGKRALITAVTASLIDQVTAKIDDPEVPMWMNEEKGREEPNYTSPTYIREMKEAERLRGLAAMDAIIMFGIELQDGVPDPKEDNWLDKLRLLGIDIDPQSPLEIEFAYKKYVAVSPEDIELVTEKSGITAEDVAAAERSFRGKAERAPD
jgi:hypothetical protein